MVLSPHGVGGQVKVFPYSDFPERIKSLDRLVLKSNQGHKEMLIETASIYGRFWLVKFYGVDNREQAVNLRESLLIIPLTQRVALPEGSGQLIGKVVDLHLTGGHDLLIVEKEDEAEKKIMIPAVKKFIKKIDQKAKIIVVELPEGLLDL